MLKSTLGLAALSLFLLGTTAASAADLYGGPRVSMKDDAPTERACSGDRFSGFYAGVNAGMASHDTKWEETFADFPDYQDNPLRKTNRSFTGGGQIGYNRVRCNALFGVEADFNLADISSRTDHYHAPTGANTNDWLRMSDQLRNFATLRARMGFVHDRTLFYATGGLAWANLKHHMDDVQHINSGLNNPTISGWKTGWTVGLGMEHAFTDRISLKGEALYMNFGSVKYTLQDDLNPPDIYNFKNRSDVYTARIGLNFKLGEGR
jgi:outer membrane immunogenic protein